MDNRAFFKIGYGLYILSAHEDGKDNACVINTVTQVTTDPCRMTLAVNKLNRTHDMIRETGLFNVSILTQKAPFGLFRHFGYQSGKNVDKFVGRNDPRSENGLVYLDGGANAFMSGKLVSATDLGTHTLFLADVTEARLLSDDDSVTYDYYQKKIKPAPTPSAEKKKGWRCRICGYVYENEELPPDFICPLCKHGASDFERIV